MVHLMRLGTARNVRSKAIAKAREALEKQLEKTLEKLREEVATQDSRCAFIRKQFDNLFSNAQ